MIPQLSAASVRQAMKWASDERRLAQGVQRRARLHASASDIGDVSSHQPVHSRQQISIDST